MQSRIFLNFDIFCRLIIPPPSSAEKFKGSNTGVWIPGEGIRVDFRQIIEILLPHFDATEPLIQNIADGQIWKTYHRRVIALSDQSTRAR